MGFDQAIRGMRNPMNSWDKSDSGICKGGYSGIGCVNCAANPCDHGYNHSFQIGKNDYELMMKLVKGGPVHAKFRRMITVYVDITAPLYWWKEFDTYKVGTVANSCSSLYNIKAKWFTIEDFSHDQLVVDGEDLLKSIVRSLNAYRQSYLDTKNKLWWWQMIQLLPSSYNQKRTVMLNYEVLTNIYKSRQGHRLNEWGDFCCWIESLIYSELIIGGK
jgi:hypothetical protein